MKATEQYLPVVLFIMLYNFESVNEILLYMCDHSMKATEKYFPMVLFTMLLRIPFEAVL